MLEQAKNYLLIAPWMSVFPGLFILTAALRVILVGRAACSGSAMPAETGSEARFYVLDIDRNARLAGR